MGHRYDGVGLPHIGLHRGPPLIYVIFHVLSSSLNSIDFYVLFAYGLGKMQRKYLINEFIRRISI